MIDGFLGIIGSALQYDFRPDISSASARGPDGGDSGQPEGGGPPPGFNWITRHPWPLTWETPPTLL